jgi:glycosidase
VTSFFRRSLPANPFCRRARARIILALMLMLLCLAPARLSRGEAMLELFQQTWPQITAKMPELAEAGYDAIYVPNPCKGNSGGFSVGYDVFDPFDLGSTNQQGTVATAYGTQAQLIQMVQTAHRFGIRVYFDNVANHRADVVPGYKGGGSATTYYPGLIPQDFHLQSVSGGYQNWANISDYCNTWQVENQVLEGLCDLAQEPGTVNNNFGSSLGSTTTKPVFIRFPGRTDLYMDTNGASLGAGTGTSWPSPANGYGPLNGWRPFDGHGQPVPEDVSTYLCRAVMWTMYTTGNDGFRLDAVKHVPANFFGNEPTLNSQIDDPQFGGYTGAIQAMYDYVHGYGNNVDTNGYIETDGNRNSLFNTEAPRNDAMIFGEYPAGSLDGPGGGYTSEDYYDYLNSGMRLLNFPLYNVINSTLGNYGGGNGMYGMDGRDYMPTTSQQGNCDGNGNFSMAQAVNFPQAQDPGDSCCPENEALENAYFFTHEGLPMVYSDGFHHNTGTGTPIVSYFNYLGEFGDNSGPDTMYTHNQLSRGLTKSRWSDQNIVMYERYDNREGNNSVPSTQAVVLFGMNDDLGNPGDITFDDGFDVSGRLSDGYYLVSSNCSNPSLYHADISRPNPRGAGISVLFPPGTILTQLSSSGDVAGGHRDYYQLLVHGATNNMSAAVATETDPHPINRLIYVNVTPPAGGGAIELVIPSGGWVMYGIQWPQASQNNPYTNAIIFTQGGAQVPSMTVYRQDGPNGQTNYSPLFPFKMRGSVDAFGNVLLSPNEGNVSNLTYAINVPVVTNGAFNILVNSDGSCSNTLVKLDGGIDLNSQMGIGPTTQTGLAPTNFLDLRDNPPGYSDDVFLGYEQTAFNFRNGPEKFAARNPSSNNIVSLGAETYYYTVGGTSNVVTGLGYGASITNTTAQWVWHDPTNSVTASNTNAPSQRNPLVTSASTPVDIWIKAGYSGQINTCFIYYTTDGSNPEGSFGIGKGTTQVQPAFFVSRDSVTNNIDWWKGTIPALPNGTQVRYKVALFNGGSYGVSVGNPGLWPSITSMTNADSAGSKLFGLTQAAITNFDPTTAVVWYHNDLNPANKYVGLQTGFHIIRARTFLSRPGQSSVYNTFSQTFYYDGSLPSGVIASPASGTTISNTTYAIVIRGDSSVTEADVNIQDSATNTYDLYTGQANGIGTNSSGQPVFVAAPSVTPNPALSTQYPNYPQEFQLNFPYVPTGGVVNITVHLKELTSSISPNRFTSLNSSVTANAPNKYISISNPSQDGQIVTLPNGAPFTIQACFTTNIPNSVNNFYIYVNGVFQSRSAGGNFYTIGGSACGPGFRMLSYNWLNPVIGSNNIQVMYSNTPTVVSDTKSVIITQPLQITSLTGNNQLLWTSAPGLNYVVLATTNLSEPFEPISDVIPSQGTSTFYSDQTYTNTVPMKFYEIELLSSP